jgi:outer membrane protein OmpA-like peptidoglycan-associated protein
MNVSTHMNIITTMKCVPLALALVLTACAIPRDVPTQSTGKSAELNRFANLQTRLDKLASADPARYAPIADTDSPGLVANINDTIRFSSAEQKYDWAKAQCWVRNAYSERHERDAAGFPVAALIEAEKIVQGLESGNNTYKATVLINHKERVRPDLWARAEALKKSSGFACAAHTVGCLEVQLSRSGHELAETGWRHANSYLAIAEDMVARGEAQAKNCVPPAPPPAPVVAEPPAKPATTIEKVTLNASALFRFDKRSQADLLPQGKIEMDQLAERIKQVYATIERIDLVGHTDRLGSNAYNAKLSLDRAETVKAYLQSKGVTAPMTTRGVGEAEPVVQCEGTQPTPKLTACLQPNRRVEISIVGIKK